MLSSDWTDFKISTSGLNSNLARLFEDAKLTSALSDYFFPKTAQKDSRVGDGYCDDMFNWHVCDFDGGDCCTNSSTKVNTMFCEDCFCLQNYPVTDQCYFKAKIGNKICDDLANTEECSYDGGKYLDI